MGGLPRSSAFVEEASRGDNLYLDITELASHPEWQEEWRRMRNPWGNPTIGS